LMACPTWSALLGIAESPPADFDRVSSETVTTLLAEAGQVVGSL
jgi:hypothetical protein